MLPSTSYVGFTITAYPSLYIVLIIDYGIIKDKNVFRLKLPPSKENEATNKLCFLFPNIVIYLNFLMTQKINYKFFQNLHFEGL